MFNGARNLFVPQTIVEVDWYGTFSRKQLMNMVWYVYYDYQTGRVYRVPAWTSRGAEVFSAIEPEFHPACRTALDCEVEMQRYLGEDCREEQHALETHWPCEVAEERVAPLSALWWNAFTPFVIQTRANAGEAVDRIITAFCSQQAVHEGVRTLRQQEAAARTDEVSEKNTQGALLLNQADAQLTVLCSTRLTVRHVWHWSDDI